MLDNPLMSRVIIRSRLTPGIICVNTLFTDHSACWRLSWASLSSRLLSIIIFMAALQEMVRSGNWFQWGSASICFIISLVFSSMWRFTEHDAVSSRRKHRKLTLSHCRTAVIGSGTAPAGCNGEAINLPGIFTAPFQKSSHKACRELHRTASGGRKNFMIDGYGKNR